MKIFLSICVFLMFIITQTCNNKSTTPQPEATNQDAMELTGTIQQQGMTSYQYGTHTITTATDEFYALKSDAVDLDNYINKQVTIIAEKIEGYPLSGGPEYLLVLEVKGS